jgi:DNA-binding response OmpR family regulator
MARDLQEAPLVAFSVDDDPAVSAVVAIALQQVGFKVYRVGSGKAALALMERVGLPDIAIVDMNMPEMGGVEFCRVVQAYSDFPALMLTAVHETNAIVHVLTHIAEDYMVKPFRPPEMIARVQRILDRLGIFPFAPGRVITAHAALQIDFVGQQALVNGQPIPLTPLESRLLYILMRQTGDVLSPSFIGSRLWPRELFSNDRVRVTIHRLRQKIEPEDGSLAFIFTERGDGYRFLH